MFEKVSIVSVEALCQIRSNHNVSSVNSHTVSPVYDQFVRCIRMTDDRTANFLIPC